MPNEAAGIVLRSSAGNVLLLRRVGSGEWGLPGGKSEDGETPVQNALRELTEETGLVLQPADLQPLRRSTQPDGFVFTCYKATVPQFEPVLGDGEHDAWQWCSPGALPSKVFMDTAGLIGLGSAGVAMDKALPADNNGWHTYTDNPISTEGVFPYLGSTVGDPALQPDEVVMVYRPGEELAAAADSFKLVPWIAGHTQLGEGEADASAVGVGGVIGENVYYRDGVLYGNLKVFGSSVADPVAAGIKELSLGYRAEFERSPGSWNGQAYQYIMRNIQGNHLASVPEGRCGPLVSVQDSFSINPNGESTMDEEVKARLEALEKQHAELRELLEAVKAAIEAKKESPVQAKVDEAAGEEQEQKDEAEAVSDDEDDEDDKKAPSAPTVGDMLPQVLAAIAKRDKLASQLSAHVGVFDHADMTLSQVQAYGAEKLGVPADELAGYLRALSVRPAAQVADAAEQPAAMKWLVAHI